MSSRSLADLESALRAAASHSDVRAVGIESEGTAAFCAGASFEELKALGSEQDAERFFLGFAKVICALRDLPVFAVCRVQGKAVGGALGLLAASDVVIAAEGAEVRLSELSIGLGPFVVGPAVERKIGLAAFQELTIDTGWRNSAWARDKGLFTKIVGSGELDAEFRSELERLAAFSADATAQIKRMFWSGLPDLERTLAGRAKTVARLLLASRT